MNRKMLIPILLVILALFTLSLAYSANETSVSDNKTMINVSSEGPIDLNVIIEDIKTHDNYKGYDNDTVKWMESLQNKSVFVSSDAFVVMNASDAKNVPSQYVNDAKIVEFIKCGVLENRSLGDGENMRDVLLVEDVKYMGKEIHYVED